jgi:HEPN domain-containing protein
MAHVRLREANSLLANRQWSGAYYLSGYAIECALKAIIAKRFKANTFPDQKTTRDVFVHDLQQLVSLAGLKLLQQQAFQADQALENNWLVVKDWTEVSRYETWTRVEAKSIVSAISDTQHGVLKWVESVW